MLWASALPLFLPANQSCRFCFFLSGTRTIESVADRNLLRELPAVHEVLEGLSPAWKRLPRALVVGEIRRALNETRSAIQRGQPNGPTIESRVEQALARLEQPSLRRVINATGVVLHTNLGR